MPMRRLACAGFALAFGLIGISGMATAGDEHGRFMMRLLTAVDIPDSNGTTRVDGVFVPQSKSDISVDSGPAAAFNYFLTDNFALEAFCCLSHHQVEGAGSAAGLRQLADFWVFAPMLTAQYHFTGLGAAQPYVGIGAQYLHFFDIDRGENVLQAQNLDINDSVGLVTQVGLNVSVGNGLYLNADVKRTFTRIKSVWRNSQLLGGADVVGNADVADWIISGGVGYRFNLGDLFGPGRPASY